MTEREIRDRLAQIAGVVDVLASAGASEVAEAVVLDSTGCAPAEARAYLEGNASSGEARELLGLMQQWLAKRPLTVARVSSLRQELVAGLDERLERLRSSIVSRERHLEELHGQTVARRAELARMIVERGQALDAARSCAEQLARGTASPGADPRGLRAALSQRLRLFEAGLCIRLSREEERGLKDQAGDDWRAGEAMVEQMETLARADIHHAIEAVEKLAQAAPLDAPWEQWLAEAIQLTGSRAGRAGPHPREAFRQLLDVLSSPIEP